MACKELGIRQGLLFYARNGAGGVFMLLGNNKEPDTYKEINIHGKINSELDEIDLKNKIIYENKSAEKLYMENPDCPQTEQQWANKHILSKGGNRIKALLQDDFRLSSKVTFKLPPVSELKTIRNYIFRIDADTPELRIAVQNTLNILKERYPEFIFSAVYGGK